MDVIGDMGSITGCGYYGRWLLWMIVGLMKYILWALVQYVIMQPEAEDVMENCESQELMRAADVIRDITLLPSVAVRC